MDVFVVVAVIVAVVVVGVSGEHSNPPAPSSPRQRLYVDGEVVGERQITQLM
jgi:hypothetical protein